jgi:HJR/Mrr/RecB family endonuclease
MGTQLVDTNDILAGLNRYSFPHPDQSFEDVRACLLEAVEQGNRQAFDVIKAKLSEAKNWEWTNEHIDTFTHRDFEFLIADLWATYGYETNVTQGKRDAGRDVECRADGETVFIEVKQHSGKVGSKVCQQAAGLYKEHDLEEVVLLTSSGFTQPAIDRATQNDVRLIAGGELRERLNSSPLVPPLGFL